MVIIKKYQQVLGFHGNPTDHAEMDKKGGRRRVMELCAEKMIQLSKIEDPWQYLSLEEAMDYLHTQTIGKDPSADVQPEESPSQPAEVPVIRDPKGGVARLLQDDRNLRGSGESAASASAPSQQLRDRYSADGLPKYLPCMNGR